MIEVKRRSHDALFPVGSIWWEAKECEPKYALYDIYENELEGEYVEIWVPLKEMPKDPPTEWGSGSNLRSV